jgi:hypothetical protein
LLAIVEKIVEELFGFSRNPTGAVSKRTGSALPAAGNGSTIRLNSAVCKIMPE